MLEKFSKQELKSLGNFVRSPYFNTKKESIVLFDFLEKYYPDFSNAKLTYEAMFAAIYPQQKLNIKKLSYVISYLSQLCEKFIATEQLFKHPFQSEIARLTYFAEIELEIGFNKSQRELEKNLEQFPYRNAEYYYYNYQLQQLKQKYQSRAQNHHNEDILQNTMDQLDFYYLCDKLRLASEMLNRQNIVAVDYKMNLLEEIMQVLHKKTIQNPLLIIYYNLLLCLQYPEEESHFSNLLENLTLYSQTTDPIEARQLYLLAVNYGVLKAQEGNLAYLQKILNIQQEMLDRNLIYDEKGYLSQWSYTNFVRLNARLGHIDAAFVFVDKYKHKLPPDQRDNAYNFNLAYVLTQSKALHKAQLLLNEVVFDDVFYFCEAKVMLLQIYYLLEQINPLLSLLDSFRVYLGRNALISQIKKEAYVNFVKIIGKLVKIYDNDKTALLKIKTEIANTRRLVGAMWLTDRINEKLYTIQGNAPD
ncbi:MAG: hypothetical protein R2798_00755 [Chitinophagales bacterium]|nr:hypothetical protein [Bacteroidota bacterium]